LTTSELLTKVVSYTFDHSSRHVGNCFGYL
jgi:hypothetical protein